MGFFKRLFGREEKPEEAQEEVQEQQSVDEVKEEEVDEVKEDEVDEFQEVDWQEVEIEEVKEQQLEQPEYTMSALEVTDDEVIPDTYIEALRQATAVEASANMYENHVDVYFRDAEQLKDFLDRKEGTTASENRSEEADFNWLVDKKLISKVEDGVVHFNFDE